MNGEYEVRLFLSIFLFEIRNVKPHLEKSLEKSRLCDTYVCVFLYVIASQFFSDLFCRHKMYLSLSAVCLLFPQKKAAQHTDAPTHCS